MASHLSAGERLVHVIRRPRLRFDGWIERVARGVTTIFLFILFRHYRGRQNEAHHPVLMTGDIKNWVSF